MIVGKPEEVGRTRIEQLVRGLCGDDHLRRLVTEMRNHRYWPGMLPPGQDVPTTQPKLAAAYSNCVVPVQRHVAALDSVGLAELRTWLPWHTEDVDVSLLPVALLEQATWVGFYTFDPEIFTMANPSAALYVSHPDLLPDTDRDGLLHVAGYDADSQILTHSGSAVPYHQFLWRNFDGHVNDGLVRTLLDSASSGASALRLALNEQHFMDASAFSSYFEHDHWFGPPLKDAFLDDPHAVGLIVHGDSLSGLTHEYPRLYVHWAMDKEGHKVVQIEELSDHDGSSRNGLHLLRYLHAIRDIERGVFVHCDGAVRAYTEAQYTARVRKNYLTGRESAGQYRKVFRLDGEISTDTWSNTAAQWFRGNRLMMEYLKDLSHVPAG